MTKIDALDKLKDISGRLDTVEFEFILDLFQVFIGRIPIPIAKLEKNTCIDRARLNDGNNLFTKVAALDFINDPDTIDKNLTEFGRANIPHQPMFYGATESTLIRTNRITALYEVSELLQDRENSINIPGELYTVSRWRNNEELSLAEVVFAADAVRNNPDTQRAFHKQLTFAEQLNSDDKDFFIDLIIFISNEFARKKVTHHDYKISAAYAALALRCSHIQGIAYPSVATDYYGQNVVFSPDMRRKYITVETLATQRVYKNKLPVFINNHKNCENPNADPDNLIWVDVKKEFVASHTNIMKHIGL